MNSKVFEQKFVSLTPTLYRFAYSLLCNEQDAEDAVQDVLITIWREADRIDEMESPRGYIMKTLRNHCIDMLRERSMKIDWEEVVDSAAEPDIGEQVDSGKILHHLMNKLQPKAQKIVMLRHIGNYSMEEISRIMGEREDNVRQILSRSRRKLYQIYQKTDKS